MTTSCLSEPERVLREQQLGIGYSAKGTFNQRRQAVELEAPPRYTRLSNGFSRKLENHIAAVALLYFVYNFIRIHRTLRVTPAMAAGVTDRLWDVSDLVALLEAAESKKAA